MTTVYRKIETDRHGQKLTDFVTFTERQTHLTDADYLTDNFCSTTLVLTE